jgi:hypothetical protein
MSKAKKSKTFSSADINKFIKVNAQHAVNWNQLADMLAKALGVRLTQKQIKDRGNRLRVRTKGITPQNVASAVPKDRTKITPADPVAAKVLDLMQRRKQPLSVEELADAADASPRVVRRALDDLQRGGHNVSTTADLVELSREIPKADPFRIDARKLGGKVFRFGVTADNHLASKYERLDVLEALFDTWAEQDITHVYQLGNIIDGDARFNAFDVKCRGLEAQSRYLATHWPKRDGINTYFITGDDHEGWYVQREGVEVGRYMEAVARDTGREDLTYLGHMEHDILFTGRKQRSVMRLIHAGGGSSYATSYAAQKIVESYQGGEKPQILLVGHYHKAEYGYPREVHVIQGGCTCDQTPFMRKQKIQAHVGGWTVEVTINPDGVITRFRSEWMPFYDKGFYTDAWDYKDLSSRRTASRSATVAPSYATA